MFSGSLHHTYHDAHSPTYDTHHLSRTFSVYLRRKFGGIHHCWNNRTVTSTLTRRFLLHIEIGIKGKGFLGLHRCTEGLLKD